jgi:quinohemoprotein ethanol dehydrogenase
VCRRSDLTSISCVAIVNPSESLNHTRSRASLPRSYSKLNQVTADNIGQLGLGWYADISERGGYQSTPLVIDGVLYVTAPWSSLYAFDAKSGKQLWKVDPQAPREIAATSICCNISNRGAAYADGKIIWGTIDGRLMAGDAILITLTLSHAARDKGSGPRVREATR